jgi:hypothetical protein
MANNNFNRGDATQIAYQCTIDITGSNRALDPSAKLSFYNVQTEQEVFLIKKDIRENTRIGLPAYDRIIDLAELNDLSKDWTILQLSDVIYRKSTSTGEATPATLAGARSLASNEPGWSDALSGYVRENPIQAVLLSAAAGLFLGFLLGNTRR